ncbi:alanine--tRNA ligase [Caldichromatium japonicum]|uniref:Alanine--tRNA ligase n=1 Tax=Caldichromatium japonicum TaxID=2699430 RepID=A0A6G7VCX0_9GAMM|nr:alanine--tRNA ligase [Caldichromatium japonicum]QIK37750.1 alanine--tRNA ligase [Caldichromatium japonicum]
MTKSAALRDSFLDYFAQRQHQRVPSSPLIPPNDPTLLFTNAGMVQFKDVFLGRERRPYSRAVSAQRCVRAGGKHNDLENVGYTARHHTFFEMLGNFSFGDYFKREAIEYAWDYLTRVLAIPPERLWVTVFEEDDEAARIWLNEIGVDPKRFSRCGLKDNFWSMGDTGPCGPCSEIFYDHGPEIPGGPPGSPKADGDRYVEIWNLVFMQYNRDADGNLTPLPHPSVDTGMGLERLAAVMQGVHSNYEIDLFRHLIESAAQATGCTDLEDKSLRVIADHIRSTAFLMTDGVTPSNEGRGYVLRRIMRRAIRHGYRLGCTRPFFHTLVAPLVHEMGAAYPELHAAQSQVERLIKLEEERFAETLEHGLRLLDEAIAGLSGSEIPGETVFKLYDTYGFPIDLTADIARERGLSIDLTGFEQAMAQQRERARAASQFGPYPELDLQIQGETDFCGYDRLHEDATIVALYQDGQPRDSLEAGESGIVILDRSPFYGESGGQVGDRGWITSETARFEVDDTQKEGEGVLIHLGQIVEGQLAVGDRVEARVDAERRQATALNHSATHLLHAALRQILGPHVQQKGSLVGPERLRFDFSHFEPLAREQIIAIERLVNREIRANHLVEIRLMSLEDAKAAGAMALFGEKYGEQVRVLRMGDFSTELCGGTHVKAVGDIGLFKIISETGIAAGVRRIEAVTGATALAWVEADEERLLRLANLLRGGRDDVEERLGQLLERARRLERELEQLKTKSASSAGQGLVTQAIEIQGVKTLAARLDGADPKMLRVTLDQLKDRLGSAVIVLATEADGKVNLVAGVTKDLTDRLPANDLICAVAEKVGGKGGGRSDMAQAGGTNPNGLPSALALVADWVKMRLTQ